MFSNFIYQLRLNFSKLVIIAGNVVTGDMTQELILNGADIVKCGIGIQVVCVLLVYRQGGYPQLSSVIECADADKLHDGHIIMDGGCVSSGDVYKSVWWWCRLCNVRW